MAEGEVNRGQNVAKIKQMGSELKEGNGSEQEQLNLFKSNQGFKKDQRWLLTG